MKTLLLSIALTLVAATSFSQTQFHFRYGSPFADEAKKVIQTNDGNYLVVGTTKGFGSAGNAFLMKVNSLGTILWVKDYAGINYDEAFDVIELSDGNIMVCGSTQSYGAGNLDGFLMKTDSIGNMIWANAYGNIFGEYFLKISEDGDGGFYIAGYAQKTPSTTQGTIILRMDGNGIILWCKWVALWSAQGDWFPIDLTPVATGGVIVTGAGGMCWKYSPTGNLVWSHGYNTGAFQQGISILEDAIGNIYLNSVVYGVASSVDIALLKLDSTGNIIWLKSYGSTYNDQVRTISKTSDGGIIICGFSNSAGNGDYDACLIKLDQNGSVQWGKAYGDVWYENSSNAVQTSDGGYVLTGRTYSIGVNPDSLKIHLVKTDSLGNSTCNSISWNPIEMNHTATISAALVPESITFQKTMILWSENNRSFYNVDVCNPTSITETDVLNSWTISPNPFSTQLTFSLADNQPTTISLYNFLGQQVLKQTFTNSTTINTEQLADGIYFYELRNDKGAAKNGKVLKQ